MARWGRGTHHKNLRCCIDWLNLVSFGERTMKASGALDPATAFGLTGDSAALGASPQSLQFQSSKSWAVPARVTAVFVGLSGCGGRSRAEINGMLVAGAVGAHVGLPIVGISRACFSLTSNERNSRDDSDDDESERRENEEKDLAPFGHPPRIDQVDQRHGRHCSGHHDVRVLSHRPDQRLTASPKNIAPRNTSTPIAA